MQKLKGKVKPKDEDDRQIADLDRSLYVMAPNCFAKAGDCDLAWNTFVNTYPKDILANVKDEAQKDTIMRSNFDSMVSKCKGKVQ